MARRAKPWLIGAGIIVLLIIAAVVAAPFLVPVDAVRDRLIAQVRQDTGRDLAIKGPVSVSVFPVFGVSVKDVTLSNAPWAGPQPMLSLAALDLRVRVLPLLSGKVAVDTIVLQDPVINLQTDRQGQGNWQLTKASAAPPPAPATSQGGGKQAAGPEITLGKVRLANGRVVYTDGASGRSETVDAINVTVHLPDFDGPLAVDGSARWQGRALSMALNAAQTRALLQGAGSPIDLTVKSDLANVAFKGQAALAGKAKGGGDLDVAVPSVRELALAAGSQPAQLPPKGLGPLSFKTHLALEGNRFSLDDLAFSLDAIHATGRLALVTGGARPVMDGALNVDRLDLNPYLPPESKTAAQNQPGASSGWSDQPIDASALRSADADLSLAAGSIAMRKIELGRSAVHLVLKDGRLAMDLTQLELYQGHAQGRAQIDASGPALAAQAQLSLHGLQAEPLAKALIDKDFVTGTATGETSLSTRGNSQRQLVAALSGKGRFSFANGAIKGVDLGSMIGNVQSAFTGGGGGAGGGGGQTEFGQLTGTYTITKGVVNNPDLSLQGPVLNLAGAGDINLPDRTLNYRLVPGQGGAKKGAGLQVAVLAKGSWDHLTYAPDVSGVSGRQLGAQAGKMLDTLTGGNKPGSQEQAQVPPKKSGGGLPIPIPIPGLSK
jgi:AsmA protein